MRKIIIVEGKQDAAFVKAIAPDVETKAIEIQELGEAGKDAIKALKIALTRVKNDALLKPVDKIGILLDLDPADFNEASKLAFVNAAVNDVFGAELESVGNFCKIADIEVRLACHFISPNLDVLLKQIAAKPSPKADCLHACLESQNHIKQKEKEKEKAWPLYYMRWDICDVKERENGAKYVNFSHTYSKRTWNLEAPVLNDLKAFLVLF